jgi:hypothetical protein
MRNKISCKTRYRAVSCKALFGIAIGIDELALEFRNLGRQSGQNVHATICGADEPFPHLEAFRNFENAGFQSFALKPTSLAIW